MQADADGLCLAGQNLVEVLAAPDQAVGRVVAELGPRDFETVPAADDAQALVVQPAVLRRSVDLHVVQLLDRAWGQAIAADLLAGEGRLLEHEDVEALSCEVIGSGRACRPSANDDDIGVPRGGAGSGGSVSRHVTHGGSRWAGARVRS